MQRPDSTMCGCQTICSVPALLPSHHPSLSCCRTRTNVAVKMKWKTPRGLDVADIDIGHLWPSQPCVSARQHFCFSIGLIWMKHPCEVVGFPAWSGRCFEVTKSIVMSFSDLVSSAKHDTAHPSTTGGKYFSWCHLPFALVRFQMHLIADSEYNLTEIIQKNII